MWTEAKYYTWKENRDNYHETTIIINIFLIQQIDATTRSKTVHQAIQDSNEYCTTYCTKVKNLRRWSSIKPDAVLAAGFVAAKDHMGSAIKFLTDAELYYKISF